MTNSLKRTVVSLHKLSDGILNMKEIQRDFQSSKILDTMNSYQTVNQNIKMAANGVLQVSDMMMGIDKARTEVIDLVSELSSISEENETSTRTTSHAADELANSMKVMKDEVKQLRTLAENLSYDVKLFKL